MKRWRDLVADARALLAIAAELHHENPGKAEHWAALYGTSVETFKEEIQKRQYPAGNRMYSWKLELEFREHVDRWVTLGALRPLVGWDPASGGHVKIGAVTDTQLFSALARQLLFAVCRVEGLAWCHGCKGFYEPERRPKAGQRSYCPECREGPVPERHAKRDQRRRMRKARSSE